MSSAMTPIASDPEHDLRAALILLKDFSRPNPVIFWTDMIASAAIGWGAFAGACSAEPWSLSTFLFAVLAILALYRASAFIHEIAHVRRGALPGFKAVWNLLVGWPLCFPSILHERIHANHHRASTYGTIDDPEYIWVKGKPLAICCFVLAGLVEPVLLALRFLILGPVGLVCPPWQRRLEKCGSSLAINPVFRRSVGLTERRRILSAQVGILFVWGIAIAFACAGYLPWRVFAVWYGVFAGVCVVNHLRTLMAHYYDSEGHSLERAAQVMDSIDMPGAWWTELWAPVGMRYHALHHLAPQIPYHNMGRAYRRLTASLPSDSTYRALTSRGTWASFQMLWRGR